VAVFFSSFSFLLVLFLVLFPPPPFSVLCLHEFLKMVRTIYIHIYAYIYIYIHIYTVYQSLCASSLSPLSLSLSPL
jgi:hypothetical protein